MGSGSCRITCGTTQSRRGDGTPISCDSESIPTPCLNDPALSPVSSASQNVCSWTSSRRPTSLQCNQWVAADLERPLSGRWILGNLWPFESLVKRPSHSNRVICEDYVDNKLPPHGRYRVAYTPDNSVTPINAVVGGVHGVETFCLPFGLRYSAICECLWPGSRVTNAFT